MKYTDLTSALQGRAAAEHQIHAAEVSEKNAAFEERKRKFQALKHEVEETYTARVGALVNAISLAAKTNFEAGYELIPWLPLSELMIAEYPNRAEPGDILRIGATASKIFVEGTDFSFSFPSDGHIKKADFAYRCEPTVEAVVKRQEAALQAFNDYFPQFEKQAYTVLKQFAEQEIQRR